MKPLLDRPLRLVVIGGSAGAFDALNQILPRLPGDYPAPVVVVVHLPASRPSLLPELFATRCRLTCREASDKELLAPGHLYFAPPDYHVLVESDLRATLNSDDPVNGTRPSIDVLFESAADSIGGGVVGVLLTGANADGAAGLRAIHEAGGVTAVQDPNDAAVAIMPYAAIATFDPTFVGDVANLADFLNALPGRPASG